VQDKTAFEKRASEKRAFEKLVLVNRVYLSERIVVVPIYEYQCEECGHKLEKLMKMSDPAPVTCPACEKPGLKKQVSAAAFRLKGSGWYETDFKTGSKKNVLHGAGGSADAGSSSSSSSDSGSAGSGASSSGGDKAAATSKSSETSSSKPAPTK
jgi:putative FmdB family regulatory protein